MPDHGELWLRLDTHGLVPIRVDTTPSALDTEIAVFKSCAEAVQGKAESSNDDARGLAAAVSVIPTTRNESYLLRIRDLGEAGAFSIVATDGGLISGRVTDAISAAPLADAD
jgi:hypothetical protein